MKLQASPTIAFAAKPKPQRLSGLSIAPRDSVRFGSAMKLATITAEEIAKLKTNPVETFTTAIHEWGHGIMASLEKRIKIKKIEGTAGAHNNTSSAGALQIDTKYDRTLFKGSEEIAAHTMRGVGGAVAEDIIMSDAAGFKKLCSKKITPKQFFKYGGGDDYRILLMFEDISKNQSHRKEEPFFTQISKLFRRTSSRIRAWINPHKEHALIIKWITDSHNVLKQVPEEGLFRLAKTLEHHGTIEGHETIERLVKEALGKNYDTLQKQFNTLVSS